MFLTVIGDHDERTVQQLERCLQAETGSRRALSGVGYDIGCGNKAVRTDLRRDDIAADLPRIMDTIVERVSFGVGRHNDEPVDHPVLDAIPTAAGPQGSMLDLAAGQLGTVGAGNHHVDLFADEGDVIWVGVHFGSRGFGHKTETHYLALAGERRGGAADEAPDAHKRLDQVLAEHGDSIRVLHRLTPIGVAMAGPHIHDPYKD